MKLYLIPSACSLAAHILVREAELNVELIKVDLATKKLPDGRAYSEIAPKGQVTALTLDNGELLTENIAVLFHLASLAPREAFLPATGTLEHIRTTEWLTYVATEMHKQIFWTIFNTLCSHQPATGKNNFHCRRQLFNCRHLSHLGVAHGGAARRNNLAMAGSHRLQDPHVQSAVSASCPRI